MENLSGGAIFWDSINSVVLQGRLSLLSDGVGRSEIVIAGDDGHEERLVFRHGTTWVPVYQLIQVIQEVYPPTELEAPAPEEEQSCPNCGGTRMVQDAEGNWHDCRACVP